MQRAEYEAFMAALKNVDVFVEDVCIEVDVDDDYEMIEDLPGTPYYDEYGESTLIDWDFLAEFPSVEAEVLRHVNFMAELDRADYYTRRAESGWADA